MLLTYYMLHYPCESIFIYRMMLIKEGFNDLDWIYIPRMFLSFLYVLDFKKGDLGFHGEGKIQKVLQTNN